MFTTPFGSFINPSLIASFLLFFSTNAATKVAKHDIPIPIPILCFKVSPFPFFVYFDNKETIMRS
uniref:Transmembrane protein n=1 Tax=Medicago truncatula TaxID=3880 RepID=I3SQ85_MEDTR|nr:unknown [Medicago truncatula]